MTAFFLEHGSYLAIFVVLVLTGSGLPIPEEVPIVAAGILSAHGRLHFWPALACCLSGALVGDVVMYWIGYHFGRNVVREHPWWAHFVRPEREARIEKMIEKHGLKVFLLARFLVGLRSPVYLSAGILRVPFRRFLMIDLFCATVVIGLFFSLSHKYGLAIAGWIPRAEVGLWVVVILVLVVVAIYYWRRRKRGQPESRTSECSSVEPQSAEPLPPGRDQSEEHVGDVEKVV